MEDYTGTSIRPADSCEFPIESSAISNGIVGIDDLTR